MNKLTIEELMFLLNAVIDINQKNAGSLEKYPENKTLETKVTLGKRVQAKIAIAYADNVKEYAN